MPRQRTASIEAAIRSAIAPVVSKMARMIAAHIAKRTAAALKTELRGSVRGAPPRAKAIRPARAPAAGLTRWVADRRARRVPTFVIELVGLKTKKEIVARYGENAAFEKGKPAPNALPTPPAADAGAPDRVVLARPPIIRKAAALHG